MEAHHSLYKKHLAQSLNKDTRSSAITVSAPKLFNHHTKSGNTDIGSWERCRLCKQMANTFKTSYVQVVNYRRKIWSLSIFSKVAVQIWKGSAQLEHFYRRAQFVHKGQKKHGGVLCIKNV